MPKVSSKGSQALWKKGFGLTFSQRERTSFSAPIKTSRVSIGKVRADRSGSIPDGRIIYKNKSLGHANALHLLGRINNYKIEN
jgi:hypothetical protein